MAKKQGGHLMEDGMARFMEVYLSWAQGSMKEGLKAGGKLDRKGLAFAREMGVEKPEQVRVCMVDQMPNPKEIFKKEGLLGSTQLPAGLKKVMKDFSTMFEGAQGFTLGYVLYLKKARFREFILKHELVHVGQTEKEGGMENFMRAYIGEALYKDYEDISFEQEAFAKQGL